MFPQTAQVECLGDLQGPKFRVGELAADPIELKNGDVLEFGICKAAWLQKLGLSENRVYIPNYSHLIGIMTINH